MRFYKSSSIVGQLVVTSSDRESLQIRFRNVFLPVLLFLYLILNFKPYFRILFLFLLVYNF